MGHHFFYHVFLTYPYTALVFIDASLWPARRTIKPNIGQWCGVVEYAQAQVSGRPRCKQWVLHLRTEGSQLESVNNCEG